jgi:hypothetical protein
MNSKLWSDLRACGRECVQIGGQGIRHGFFSWGKEFEFCSKYIGFQRKYHILGFRLPRYFKGSFERETKHL